MRWSNFFHIYQPPEWNEAIVRKVCDQAYRPLIAILRRHPWAHITLNISGSLTEQLVALRLDDVLSDIAELMEAGQIELVGSAMYHPILPLLPETEIRRQIMLQHELHTRAFGDRFKPKGFFPPEMAYADLLEPILRDLGYEWVILDEAASGSIGQAAFEQRYATAGGLGLVMRHRHLSDYLSFSADPSQEPVVLDKLLYDERTGQELVTAMDGENLGHHRHGVDQLWEKLISHKRITTATLSEYRASLKKAATIAPVACSWSTRPDELKYHIPFGLWNHPDNPVHKLQWQLTYYIIDTVQNATHDPNHAAARLLLDQALTSDKYWWASASPWWDLPIILRETQRLADVVAPLQSIDPKTKNAVAQLMNEITRAADHWEKAGIARHRQATYLQTTQDVRYMGGGRIGG